METAIVNMYFRDALARLGAAVNIVTTNGAAGLYGITMSAISSVTDDPPTILACINRNSAANEAVKINQVFCVNMLAARHQELALRFSSKALTASERFSSTDAWTVLETGSPVLTDASVSLDCRVCKSTEIGSHTVFFGEVVALALHDDHECLVYFDRGFHPMARAV
jgi:flavin reductase